MNKKLAKLKYLPNNFEVLEEGDHVICALSGKIIKLEELKLLECRPSGAILFIQRSIQKKR